MKIKLLITVLAGLLLLGAVGFFARDFSTKQNNLSNQYAQSQMENATRLIEEKIQLKLTGNMDTVTAIAELYSAEEKQNWKNKNLEASVQKIASKMNYLDINICDMQGNGYNLKSVKHDVNFCSYYQKALLGDPSISFSNFDKDSTVKSIIYTVPILQDSKVDGVIRVSMSLDNIQDILSIDMFRGKEDVYFLSNSGEILAKVSNNKEDVKDFMSLLKLDDRTKETLLNEIKQGRDIYTQVQKQGESTYISYRGLTNMSDGGIMITLPSEMYKQFYENKLVTDNLQIVLFGMIVVLALLLVFITLTESMKRDRVEGLAYYDDAIGSINYNRFKSDAAKILGKVSGKNYAVVEISIDKLDYIREFFGKQEELNVLVIISKVLENNLKAEELFCRSNDNNFILLLKYHNRDELSDRINYLNDRVKQYTQAGERSDKYELMLHYGIYCIAEGDTDLDIMSGRAHYVITKIKGTKNKNFDFYTDAMQDKLIDEKEIEEHMYTALLNKEFLVFLQPKFDLNTGMQEGAEALVRWLHPEKGLMYPGRFIGVLEKNGFIVKLDLYMLEVACSNLKDWIKKGYRPTPISINISRLNLFDPNFVNNMENILTNYGIPANLIELEISEEVVTDNMEILSALLIRLKSIGVLLSMDDFGTGTTSMNTLYRVPVDELKLDQKFLRDADKTDRGIIMIKSIINSAKLLDIKVVSEGVDSMSQAKMLKEVGCDMVQGFAFSEPLPIQEYEDYAYGPKAGENRIAF